MDSVCLSHPPRTFLNPTPARRVGDRAAERMGRRLDRNVPILAPDRQVGERAGSAWLVCMVPVAQNIFNSRPRPMSGRAVQVSTNESISESRNSPINESLRRRIKQCANRRANQCAVNAQRIDYYTHRPTNESTIQIQTTNDSINDAANRRICQSIDTQMNR